MGATEDFITMVMAMRDAQRERDDNHTKTLVDECIRWETKVDRWLEKHLAEKVQLDLWTRSAKNHEVPGPYNIGDETETKKGSGA